jgi:HEAT repeat protein
VEGGQERACANAALILGELHEKQALPLLLQRINRENGDSADLQQSIVSALGRYRDRATIPPLLRLVVSANETLQRTALASLQAQGDAVLRAAWREETDPATKNRLRVVLESLL